jgi:hypothetical protein
MASDFAWVIQVAIALPISVLAHELAHATFALALTRGPVAVVTNGAAAIDVRAGRLYMRIGLLTLLGGGVCAHEDPPRQSDRALIAAAGPVMSLLIAATALTFTTPPGVPKTFGEGLAAQLCIVNAFSFLMTALPLRYPSGLAHTGDSDGLVVLRAVWPRAAAVLDRTPPAEISTARAIRWPFVVAGLVVVALALVADPLLGIGVAALLVLAYKRG